MSRKSRFSLVQYNIATGEMKKGLELNDNYWEFLEIYNGHLFLHELNDVADTNVYIGDAINKIYDITMENLDLDTEAASWKTDDANYWITEGILYKSDNIKKEFIRYDEKDQKTYVSMNISLKTDEMLYTSIQTHIDSKFITSIFVTDKQQTDEPSLNSKYFWLDFDTQQLTNAPTLKVNGTENTLVPIIGEKDDLYYVIIQYKPFENSSAKEHDTYATISKIDYNNSIPNYTLATDLTIS